MTRRALLRAAAGVTLLSAGPLRAARASNAAEDLPRIVPSPLLAWRGPVTPNRLFYIRDHAGAPVVDAATHRLAIGGRVGRHLSLSLADLHHYSTITRTYFLECAGNSSYAYGTVPANNVVKSHGLLSCGRWTGVPLSVLLDRAGADSQAGWLLAEGADAGNFQRCVRIPANPDDMLVAFALNGEPLPREHGYPMRLLVPGNEGSVSVKWLRRIEVLAKPIYTSEDVTYAGLLSTGRSVIYDSVLGVKSVMLSPSPGSKIVAREPIDIFGLAWSGLGRITAVDISSDGGTTWSSATLEKPVLPKALTVFHAPWTWSGNPCILQSRARDESGSVQPTRAQLLAERGSHYLYHMNAIASWSVDQSGFVNEALL
jgi:sulfane dehydrogenase subunit SoxC